MCLSKSDVKLYDNLMWPLELTTTDRSMWNDKCDYYDDVDKCKNLNPENYNLVVLQHNIRSLLDRIENIVKYSQEQELYS